MSQNSRILTLNFSSDVHIHVTFNLLHWFKIRAFSQIELHRNHCSTGAGYDMHHINDSYFFTRKLVEKKILDYSNFIHTNSAIISISSGIDLHHIDVEHVCYDATAPHSCVQGNTSFQNVCA